MNLKGRILYVAVATAMVINMIPMNTFASEENKVQTLTTNNTNTEENIEINEINFPDDTFRAFVTNLSLDGNVLSLEERLSVDTINLQEANITSLKGIEFFPNLEDLYCSNNKLTQLDVSQNKKLKNLTCFSNQLKTLDVSQNPELVLFQCSYNQLTSLVLNNPKLEELWCDDNQIKYLDLSNSPKLASLQCSNNSLAFLDFSNNPLMTNEGMFDKFLREIPNGSPISDLQGFDVTRASDIQGGNFDDGKINFSSDKITYTYDCGNEIGIDFVLYNSDLISEDIEINVINFPDPNFRKYVRTLKGAEDNLLTGRELLYIERINVDSLNIKSLKGIEYFTSLASLGCDDNQLTSLDISKNTKLNWLSCEGNKLTSLDLTNNPEMNRLWCDNNHLVSLDFNQNAKLEKCYVNNNKYTLPNGTSISDIPGFNLDKVSDVQGGNFDDGKVNFKSNEITFAYDCGNKDSIRMTLKCEDVEINEENFPDSFFRNYVIKLPGAEDGKFTKQELDAIKTIQVFVEFGEAGYTLKGIEYFENLEILTIIDTEIESLDLSKNKKLKDVSIYRNKLKYLDVSNNPELKWLACFENQLTSFDVSKNTKLDAVSVNDNKRTITDGIPLSELPGFDKSKASNIQGGNFDGDKVNFTSNTITYTYDCGNGNSETFTLEKGDEADYTVKHLQQQLDGTYKEVTADTQTVKAIIGEKTTGIAKKYEGFTPKAFNQKTISKNGTILEIKYDRNKHNITWDLDEGTATNKYTSGEVMFGTPIVAPEPTKKGYDFAGWDTTVAETMPDQGVTYRAVWEKTHNHVLTLVKGKAATSTEDGYKDYYECKCGKFFEDAKGKNEISDLEAWKKGTGKLEKLPTYQIVEGMNGKWNKGSKEGLTFKSDGEFEEFIGVTVDGLMIDKKNYTAKEGSTIVTLSPEYLDTLELGEHSFDMVYQSGICGTSFEIINVEEPKPDTKPNTKPGTDVPDNAKPGTDVPNNAKPGTDVTNNDKVGNVTSNNDKPVEKPVTTTQTDSAVPKTGDHTKVAVTMAALGLSILAITKVLVGKRKRS